MTERGRLLEEQAWRMPFLHIADQSQHVVRRYEDLRKGAYPCVNKNRLREPSEVEYMH